MRYETEATASNPFWGDKEERIRAGERVHTCTYMYMDNTDMRITSYTYIKNRKKIHRRTN